MPPPTLTDDEWRALDAVRSGTSPAAAAGEMGIDERAYRRLVAVGADKLRIISSLAPSPDDPTSSSEASAGPRLRVPALTPCPYCENFAGRFSPTSGAPAVIFEDGQVCVFLAPAALGGMAGHALVTTRRHVETVFDLTDDEARSLAVAVARTARMLRRAVDPEGLLIQQNNGVAAFQSVPHIHFHVIPKAAGPFPPLEPPTVIPADERATHAAELRRHWDDA
jgi:diadenosine tetraphosphate (Ap4A) HIT family hydrolase